MGVESNDPTDIRSIAVSADDVVSALEASRRTGRNTVLRVTPPFSGRMRARLHVVTRTPAGNPAPIHVDPEALVDDDTPAYPTPADTADELRADPSTTYTRERHHDRHADAVAEWRAAVRDHVVDAVTLDTPAGPHDVTVALLG